MSEAEELAKRIKELEQEVSMRLEKYDSLFDAVLPFLEIVVDRKIKSVMADYYPEIDRKIKSQIEDSVSKKVKSEIKYYLGEMKEENELSSSLPEIEGLKRTVLKGEVSLLFVEEKVTKEIIIEALRRTNYNQSDASKILGISRRILKYKMDKLGIKSSNNL